MSRRGGNRLAVLLMTGFLLGDLWNWLETVLAPWQPATQADCDQGPLIDPDGQCRSLLVEQQGVMIDPDGQPNADDGPLIDPNGQPNADDGPMIDPNGQSTTDQGWMIDPNG